MTRKFLQNGNKETFLESEENYGYMNYGKKRNEKRCTIAGTSKYTEM
jgi:hypothetical protein